MTPHKLDPQTKRAIAPAMYAFVAFWAVVFACAGYSLLMAVLR